MGWRSMLAVVAGLCLTIAGGGCEKREPAPADAGGTPKVRLALNWKPEPQFGGFYAADYGAHGVDVDVLPGGSGTPTVQMVGAGSAEFGIVSADELVVARSKGNDVVALFAVYQTNPQGLMVHAARGLKSIADVFQNEGTLAIQRGLPYADFLERKYGFGKLKVVPNTGGVPTWMQDRDLTLQCFVTSEPLTATKLGGDPQTFLVADAGCNPYTTVLITRGDYLRQNPQTVEKLVSAVRDGWRAYLDNPAGANETMAKLNPSMDAQTFADSAEAQKPLIETDESKANGLGSMTLARWAELGRQLADLKVVDAAPDPAACFVGPTR